MTHAAPGGFQHGITAEAARIILDATLAKGRELGLAPLTVVVLDAGGQLKAALKEDGSSLLRPDIAWGKAYGAMALGFGSRELARRSQSMSGFMNALSDLAGGRAVPVPGGVLVRAADGAVLGAVGVSGDLSDKDEICAVAGIKAAGLISDTGDAPA
ncbi:MULTISPECIES: GlcG/HbpS family heme-binding protein [Roseomonadaceae]|uniref:Heme-binding protein n=1 Tax=Falsiroseomonas oleicola TaxID=2801474 RepID=A0ABS6H4D6_9PROT|nr:heme-binding protein [Roseomonas oleicola]MBU8542697.1 heme-binding protein [Roseomonas oleicola]